MLLLMNGANGAAMRPVRQCISACLGFALLLASAGPARSQDVSRIARKLHWCEAHKDNFDIVFVGSSRVFHGLSPRIFDQVARANGQRWRSFNLGMDKMGMAQSMAIIRELVATGPRHLKYVFFELEPGTATLAGGQHRPAQREPPAQPSGSGLGPDGDGFFPMDKPMSPAVESFYQERLAAVKANPAPRRLTNRCGPSWAAFPRRWRRETSRLFSSSHRRFAPRTAQESMPPPEARFSLSTTWCVMRRSTTRRTAWMPSISMSGAQRSSPAPSPRNS